MPDIVITWPKTKDLGTYYVELENAKLHGHVINYRVAVKPKRLLSRCYVVYDGQVVCWSGVIEVRYRAAGEVRRVGSDRNESEWKAGIYIVRWPEYTETVHYAMRGFQGWRYFDRSLAPDL